LLHDNAWSLFGFVPLIAAVDEKDRGGSHSLRGHRDGEYLHRVTHAPRWRMPLCDNGGNEIPMERIVNAMMPFLAILTVDLVILTYVPPISTFCQIYTCG